MDDAAQAVCSSLLGGGDVVDRRRSRIEHGRCTLAERAVGSGVVVLDVLGEHGFEMAASEDDHPVEALAPDGADHALTEGVRPRGPDRSSDDPDAVGGEDVWVPTTPSTQLRRPSGTRG